MATEKQKAAVEALVGNGGNVTQAMLKAKYSPNTANTPQKLTESKGYQELLEEYGLTEGLVTKALVEDIKGKPKRRVRELELGADMLGLRKRAETQQITNNVVIIPIPSDVMERHGVRTSRGTEADS